jgi:hypothetical protein
VNVPGCGLFGFFYAVRTAIFRGVWAVAEDLHPFPNENRPLAGEVAQEARRASLEANMRHGILAALAGVCGLLGAMLAPGCDQLGLGGGGAGGYGGYGGEACGGYGGYGGGGGYGGAGGAGGAVCNIAAQSPCEEQCQADYDAAALQCGSISIEADRKTCQDNAYAEYKECRAACASSKPCDKKFQACVDRAPSSCLAEEAGKTKCYRCWEQCNAGSSPSSSCKKCLF